MSIYFLWFIPILVAAFSKVIFNKSITPLEMIIHIGVCCVFVAVLYAAAMYTETYDTKYIHSYVTNKEVERVHCRHSYPCHCRTVRSGNTTSTHCDTCYSHSYDNDWIVKSDIGQVTIDTIDDFNVAKFIYHNIKVPLTFHSIISYVNSRNDLKKTMHKQIHKNGK